MANTKQCFSCKQIFLKTELIDYASKNAKTAHSYCKECYHEKILRENFSDKICQIFGLKKPGPRIWTERKRLIDKYGYTDNIIIDCLDYIYTVEKKKKLADSLCLVTPVMVDRMLAWKNRQMYKANQMMSAMTQTKMNDYIVPIKENNEKKENILNADDFLD